MVYCLVLKIPNVYPLNNSENFDHICSLSSIIESCQTQIFNHSPYGKCEIDLPNLVALSILLKFFMVLDKMWGPCCTTVFSIHLASRSVTPAGSVHKSRGENMVCMCVQFLKVF